jgi:aryl-alcohol dehydrogenase
VEITAAVVRKPGEPFELTTLQLDAPQPDELLVRVTAVGVCHTDLSVQHGHIPVELPAVLGHEGTGVVEQAGTAVREFQNGDRVVMSQAFCGSCQACRTGAAAYCANASRLSLGGRREDWSVTLTDSAGAPVAGNFVGQSSFASHCLVKARNAIPVPAEAPPALMAPLGCGMLTGTGAVLDDVRWPPGGIVAVYGCGPVGLSALLAAKIAGATEIIGVDRVPERLALAAELAATHVIDADQSDPAAEIARITAGRGVDLAVEAAGVPALVPVALASCATTGQVVIVGAAPIGSTMTLDWWTLMAGRTVKGCVAGGSNPIVAIPRLVRYWGMGLLPLDRMVRTYPLAAINDAAADLAAGRTLKPVLVPDP